MTHQRHSHLGVADVVRRADTEWLRMARATRAPATVLGLVLAVLVALLAVPPTAEARTGTASGLRPTSAFGEKAGTKS